MRVLALKRLAAITDADVTSILHSYPGSDASDPVVGTPTSGPASAFPGRIILAGSGPGHPDLLTRATHRAIQAADLILADKLVPAGVLDLILGAPRSSSRASSPEMRTRRRTSFSSKR